jgi:L-ascorbate metabolism protein UlaG (beta-lactamase superfamily)
MKITMVGHSTVLIEVDGRKILTDPYFGTWGNPAYARVGQPVMKRDEIKNVDLVLNSHNHWDHTDRRFFNSLPEKVPVLVPGWAKWLARLRGVRHPIGLASWREWQFDGISVISVPACHIDFATGFVIQSEDRRIYFAGDTYYRPFMKEIGGRFHPGVALIPVTTYRIPMTMDNRSALRAVRDLKPSVVIPIHLGVTPRSPLMQTQETPEGFALGVSEAGLETQVVILKDGESWSPPDGE